MWFQRRLGQLNDDCAGPLWAHVGFEVGDDETATEVIAEFQRASDRFRSIAVRIPDDGLIEFPTRFIDSEVNDLGTRPAGSVKNPSNSQHLVSPGVDR